MKIDPPPDDCYPLARLRESEGKGLISIEDWAAIRALHARGIGVKAIMRQMGVARNTVRRAIRTQEPPAYRRKEERQTAMTPFLDEIRRMYWDEHLIGTRIFAELQAQGYTGSLSAVHRCLQRLRRQRPQGQERVARMETEPGEQAQFDWSVYTVTLGGQERTVYAFSYVLGYSRMKYVHFAFDVTQATVLEALECGIRAMGGVPRRLLIDNPKQLVLEHRPDGAVRYHPAFLELVGRYRIEPYACQVRRAQTKGKVERFFYVLEQHFLKGRPFVDITDLQTQGQAFVDHEHDRVNRRLGEAPRHRFAAEQAALTPLPERRYTESLRQVRQVSRDGYVSVDHVEYSVPPAYTGREVWVGQSHGAFLHLYGTDGVWLCTHPKSFEAGSVQTLPAHRAQPDNRRPSVRRQLVEGFTQGPAFYEALFRRFSHNARYHARQILDLRGLYTDAQIDQALREALAYGAVDAHVVMRLLAATAVQAPPPDSTARVEPSSPAARPLSYYGQLLH